MNITIKAGENALTSKDETLVERELAAPLRLLGRASDTALLEIDIKKAPPEGRSSEPFRLVANLSVGNKVFHAEAVKPSPKSAADRVRRELEAEIRRWRGRSESLYKRGGRTFKQMLHLGR